MNKNACTLGPATHDLPAINREIAKSRYRQLLKTHNAEQRKAWLEQKPNRAFWLEIAAEVRNEK